MANAQVIDAPLKKKLGAKELEALSQEFDPNKKYVFELASKNPEMERPVIDMRTQRPIPHKEFKPYQNLVMTSQIVWNGSRTNLRYYDGCESIFVSEQPQDKELIDQLIKQTKKRQFLEGKLIVDGYDRMLLLYLNICGWNADSSFRTNTANQIFVAVNPDKKASELSARVDSIEKALQYAKEATETKMLIHANYLGIPVVDYDSGNPLSPKEIRAAYRKSAMENPESFIESYGNKTLEVKYYIDKALSEKIISNRLNPNKAIWDKSGNEICDISGLKSSEAISERLFEFSQSEDGSDFLTQLKAIFNK